MDNARGLLSPNLQDLLSWNLGKSKRVILGDGLWVFLGQLLSAIGALVGGRLLTEFIAPEVFGAVSLFLGVILLGSNLTCAPLFQSVLRFYPELASQGNVPVLRETVRRLLIKVALLLFLVLGVGATFHSMIERRLMWIYFPVSALLLVDVLRGLDINFLSAARRHRPFAIWTGLDALARPIGAVAAVILWKASASAVLTGYALASALGYFIFRWKATPEGLQGRSTSEMDNLNLRQEILKYAFPLVPLACVAWISSLSDRYILGAFLDLEKVGLYAAAYGLVSRPFLMLGNVATLTLRPLYFEAVSKQDNVSSRKVLSSWLWLTGGLAAGGIVGFCLASDRITSLLLSEKYRGAAEIMPWLALGYSFYILATILEQVLYARKETSYLLRIHVATASFSLLAAALGVHQFGMKGAALACPCYFLFHLIMVATFARRHPNAGSRRVL